MKIPYADLEEFLAQTHRVDHERRSALKGRIKHFQRLSWPPGTNQGKGKRVQYGVGQTLSLAVAFELLQIGLTPERIVDQLRQEQGTLAEGFGAALSEFRSQPNSIFYIFSPESLVLLRDPAEKVDRIWSNLISLNVLQETLQNNDLFKRPRLAVINLSEVLLEYISYIEKSGLRSPEMLAAPIEAWQKRSQRYSLQAYKTDLGEMADGD